MSNTNINTNITMEEKNNMNTAYTMDNTHTMDDTNIKDMMINPNDSIDNIQSSLNYDSEHEDFDVDTPIPNTTDYMDEYDILLDKAEAVYDENGTTVIDMGSHNYRIIPQSAMVKACMNGHETDAIDVIFNIIVNNSKYLCMSTANLGDMLMKNTYTGTAKCQTAYDDFDPMEGIRISKTKAKDKYYSTMDKKLKMFLKDVRNIEAAMEHYLDARDVDYSDVDTVLELKVQNFTPYMLKMFKLS